MTNRNQIAQRQLQAAADALAPGNLVKWDGSGDRRYPRIYTGVVLAIDSDGLVRVAHEGYVGCISAVRADWLMRA